MRPKPGFFRRMKIYTSEMFPISPRLFLAALLYLSSVAFLGRIHNAEIPFFSIATPIGIWSVFALLFILRMMDELKDLKIDRELFPHRPIASGRVLDSDLHFMLCAVIVLYLAANLLILESFWMAVAVLGYAGLMFRFFFIPQILRKYLLLNLITHNPIAPILLFYIQVLSAAVQTWPLRSLAWKPVLLFILGSWSPLLAWEIARKIRAPEEENEYVTYSQIFGRCGAVLVAAGIQSVAIGVGFYFYGLYDLSLLFLGLLLAGYAIVLGGHVRFLVRPTPHTSRLLPFAECYALFLFAAYLLENLLFI